MVAIREFETQPTDLFGETLQSLKRRLSLFVWQGFFEPLSFVSLDRDVLTIAAPSSFHKDWVQNHYLAELQETVTRVYGQALQIRVIEAQEQAKPQTPISFDSIPSISAAASPALSQSISPLRAPPNCL